MSLNSFLPDKIILSVTFSYSRNKRYTPNDVRKSLMGVERDNFSVFNLPKYINKKILEKIGKNRRIVPLKFALIKEPIIIKINENRSKTINPAIGAVVIYAYTGAPSEIFEVVDIIKETFSEKRESYPLKLFTKMEIFLARGVFELE